MFCKQPHPVYIVLFRGDDTDFVGNQEIIVKITTERNISGCKAYFKYMGNIQTFDEIPEDKELHLVFSREQTKEMPLGTWDAELYLIDENGKRMTVNNRIHMLVTNSVREAYFPDDPQAVSVVISANKYIEDAEVSADGKTLTLTKKDGTEVSFSGGGGGGGTNDYNDLENKPSINGTTLTGNINLATPEQLSLKADKSALDNHEGDTNNPHKVTAEQVGAVALNARNTVGSSFSVKYTAGTGEGDDFSFGIGSGPSGKTFLVDKLYCSGKNRFFADGVVIVNETSAEGASILSKITEYGGDFKSALTEVKGLLAYSRNATGLRDRAFNTLSFDGTEFNLSAALEAVTPTASGQPRDLLIVATATAATTISYTAGTIKGDKPTIDGAGTWLMTLTEYASGVWYCRQIKMEDAA